jgi:hypothetical protein
MIDRTVPPFELRRFCRILFESGGNCEVFEEIKGKEHWW